MRKIFNFISLIVLLLGIVVFGYIAYRNTSLTIFIILVSVTVIAYLLHLILRRK